MEDIGFWQHNNAIKDREKIVWLLLYDLQGRKFAKPQFETANFEEREKIFEVGFLFSPFASFHSPALFHLLLYLSLCYQSPPLHMYACIENVFDTLKLYVSGCWLSGCRERSSECEDSPRGKYFQATDPRLCPQPR